MVGGGILGLAAGMTLSARRPDLRVTVLEKEPQVAAHQTGHNSGVIHSGLYYRPGTLKAALCVRGAKQMVEFCQAEGIPLRKVGKVIVARSEEESPRLRELSRRGEANGVPDLRLLSGQELREVEPHAAGVEGLHVPGVWVVDFTRVAQAYAGRLQDRGGVLRTNCRLLGLRKNSRLTLETTQGEIPADFLINCGGLQADRLAAGAARQSSGRSLPLQILPFRGEYYELVPEKRDLVRGLIYPVPDPRFPFLGVHLSRRVDGRVEAGPNAVLAFKREGYRKGDFDLRDLAQMLAFPGFWRMSARHWRTGLAEMRRSFLKSAFVRSVQELVPEIGPSDLVPGGSGVRAQAVDRAGNLLDDFHILEEPLGLHLLNAPSPAATASLAIAEVVADAVEKRLSRPG